MQFVVIGQKNMSLENEIKEVLFRVVQDIKIHKIDNINMILEIDYDSFVKEIVDIFNRNLSQ